MQPCLQSSLSHQPYEVASRIRFQAMLHVEIERERGSKTQCRAVMVCLFCVHRMSQSIYAVLINWRYEIISILNLFYEMYIRHTSLLVGSCYHFHGHQAREEGGGGCFTGSHVLQRFRVGNGVSLWGRRRRKGEEEGVRFFCHSYFQPYELCLQPIFFGNDVTTFLDDWTHFTSSLT